MILTSRNTEASIAIFSIFSGRSSRIHIKLIAAFSSSDEAVFHNELQEVSKKNSQITTVYTFSRIAKETLLEHVAELNKPAFYVVGSEDMVAETKKLLLDLGIAEEQIQTEDFTGY